MLSIGINANNYSSKQRSSFWFYKTWQCYLIRPQEMLQEYLKAVDLFTINEENRLRRQVEELTIKKSEMDEFRG